MQTLLSGRRDWDAAAFGEYTSWQDGPDTGRFLTYEDLLPPIARRALEEGDDETAVRVAAFVEELLGLGDGYAENAATVALLEGRRRAMARARRHLGERGLAAFYEPWRRPADRNYKMEGVASDHCPSSDAFVAHSSSSSGETL